MKEWYQSQKDEILKEFRVTKDGLSNEEAAKRLGEYGENVLQEEKKKSVLQVFLGQFMDLLVIIYFVDCMWCRT